MPSETLPLLIEAMDGSSERLAQRALALGIEMLRASDFDDACSELQQRRRSVGCILIPTDIPARGTRKAIRRMRDLGPASGLSFVSIGKPATGSERKKLRAAGLKIAIWEPYDDGTLRFQLNRALCGEREPNGRAALRVPTYLLARIFVGDRTKDAIVYSMSKFGAFLETPRASVSGASIELEIRLPGSPVRLRGCVVFANVPGNLHRENLPHGVGVHFEDIPKPTRRALEHYVEQRRAELDV